MTESRSRTSRFPTLVGHFDFSNFIFRLLRSHHVAKAPIVAVDVFFMKRQPNAQMVSVFQLYILLKLFRPAQDRITKIKV